MTLARNILTGLDGMEPSSGGVGAVCYPGG